MRSFERSPTNSLPLESMARAWGTSNSPCPLPALPQALMDFPSLGDFPDPGVGLLAVAVGDKNVAVGGVHNCRRGVDLMGPVTNPPRLAEPQQYLPVGTELDHLVTLAIPSKPVGH